MTPEAIKTWRRETRASLISKRIATRPKDRRAKREAILSALVRHVPELRRACIGFAWPFRGEVDLRPFVASLIGGNGGATAALPVVIEKREAMIFRHWKCDTNLEPGIWNIPVPREDHRVTPDILLVPLVGFDARGYRLGYGGGYFDRTLAAMHPRPLAIGIGHAGARLETIHPQWHDIPMDAVVTERGLVWFGHRPDEEDDAAGYASPPCSMHEIDPTWAGHMSHAELVSSLNRVLVALRRNPGLCDIAFNIALLRHLARLGGRPETTGATPPVSVCDNGSVACPVRKSLAEVQKQVAGLLPRIGDDAVHADLMALREVRAWSLIGSGRERSEP